MNRCTICGDSRRLLIDRKLVSGCAVAEVARFFEVQYFPLVNHYNKHIARQLSTAVAIRNRIEGDQLLNIIDGILQKCELIFDRNFKKGSDVTALKALDSQRNTIGLLASISAQLHQAKMAELELLKETKIDNSEELNQKLYKSFECLTDEEVKEFTRIGNKLNKYSKENGLQFK